MKLSTKIERLRKQHPKISALGLMYDGKLPAKNQQWRKIRLYTLFVSNYNTHMIRDHIFESKKKPRNTQEWHAWLAEHLTQIQAGNEKKSGAILSGLELRTGKQWSVLQIIGWVPNAKYSSRTAAVSRGRNKKSKKGGARG